MITDALRHGVLARALDDNLIVAQRLGGIAVAEPGQRYAHVAAVPLRVQYLQRQLRRVSSALRRSQVPGRVLQQRIGRLGIRLHLYPAAQTMRGEDATEYDLPAQAAWTCAPASRRCLATKARTRADCCAPTASQ